MIRRLAFGIGAVVLMATALIPNAAHAETTYRYWSYWIGGDAWAYSSRGSGFRVPPDGGVEGYRFVVSPKDGSQASPPGTASSYEALCPGQPAAPAGQKRVALVLDYGAAGIAPIGETPPPTSVQCLLAAEAATGLQVLQQVAQLRFHTSGLICGIAGFPATECPGQSVRTTSPTPTAATSAPASAAPAPVVTTIPEPTASGSPTSTVSPSTSPSASPTTTPSSAPSPVALAVESTDPPQTPGTPAWIAAIGATMIAALLGLALLARQGRE